MTKEKDKINITNKKAHFDYHIEEKFEAGIVLNGLEIKAIRAKRVNLTGSYVKIINAEVYWLGGNFTIGDGDPQRTRKLLLHQSEINRLLGKTIEKGLTIIPLRLYVTRGKAKLEIGLGRGMKNYDKRAVLKKKEQNREAERNIKQY